jgi:uncharacterized membrane protein
MMGAKISSYYNKLRASFWFTPALMAFTICILAANLLILDVYNQRHGFISFTWITLTGAEEARAILTTIAGSMITVIAIVYSITIVSLSLTSQQFGPRLLQNFMRDRGNQYVLGTVTATFLYCLLILRSVNETPHNFFVPHISILFALGMAILCVGVLIYFIHHVSESIQVTNIISRISHDLAKLTDRLYPEKVKRDSNLHETEQSIIEELLKDFERQAETIRSARSGYIQSIDYAGLLDFARGKDLIIRILHRHGHFVMPGADLAQIFPKEAAQKEDLSESVNSYFITGSKRTQEHDLEFLIDELVEIAGKALSPGINDPFTAVTCIDHLGAELCTLAQRVFPSILWRDHEKRVRIVSYPVSFGRLVDAAFNQIRQYGQRDAAVSIRLLETVNKIIPFTWNEEQRSALFRQAKMIERGRLEGLAEEEDRQKVHLRYQEILTTLKESSEVEYGR